MSLIEQAAKRLEQLRRSGAALSDEAKSKIDPDRPGKERPKSARTPTPEALVNEINARGTKVDAAGPTPPRIPSAPTTPRRRTHQNVEVHKNRVQIDLARLRERGFVTPDAPKSQIAHEFRVLKRPILRNALGRSDARVRDGNLVMVTSALPGEGKTFTAANLAISMAMEFDNTVLLVDGDVAHPSLPGVLDLTPSLGLLDLLVRDDLEAGDVLLDTNIENLTLLPAGSPNRRATELLASEKMTSLLRELASRDPDRIVIFDSPPLLATTEARVLATNMGQIIMVVAADATPKQVVNQALGTIENCEVVLMMLNKAVKSNGGNYYGYYSDDDPQ
jgi:protein-tyrosine kinase